MENQIRSHRSIYYVDKNRCRVLKKTLQRLILGFPVNLLFRILC